MIGTCRYPGGLAGDLVPARYTEFTLLSRPLGSIFSTNSTKVREILSQRFMGSV